MAVAVLRELASCPKVASDGRIKPGTRTVGPLQRSDEPSGICIYNCWL